MEDGPIALKVPWDVAGNGEEIIAGGNKLAVDRELKRIEPNDACESHEQKRCWTIDEEPKQS